MKLSELPFQKINLSHTKLISFQGTPGKISGYELKQRGEHLELWLKIQWENGNVSNVNFPDDCENITVS